MADFQFYLNRQGPRGAKGPQGEKGDAGLTYVPRTGTNTPTETTVIFQTTDGQSYETPNLKYPIEDRGGDYLRLDRDENTQYYGNPNYADLSHNPGEVILLNANDFNYGDPEELAGYAVSGQFMTEFAGDINNDFSNVNASLNTLAEYKADKSTTYTKTETNTLLNGKANTVHTHTLSQITDAGSLAGKNTVNYNTEVTNKPTIGNGTITITQGGVAKGTFTTNQSGDSTIALDAGGGGSTYSAGDGISISSDTISVKVDESTIDFDTNGKLKVIGSVAPSNMVTTNTSQDITAMKYFKSGGIGDNYLSIQFFGTNGNEYPVIRAYTDHSHYGYIMFADNANDNGCCIKLDADNAEIIARDRNANEYPMIHTGNIDTNTISYNQTNKNIEVIGGKLNTIIKTSLCKTNKNASITSNILTVPQEYYDGTDNPTSFGYVQVPATSYLYFRGVMNRLNSTRDDYGICGFGNTITTINSADSLLVDRYLGGRLTPNSYTDITYISEVSYSGNLYFDLIYDNGNTSFIIYTDDTFTTTIATYTCSSTPTTYTYIILGCRSTLTNSSNCTYDLSKSCYKTSSNGNFIPLYTESAGTVLVKGLDTRYLGIDSNNNLTLDIQAIKDAIDNL